MVPATRAALGALLLAAAVTAQPLSVSVCLGDSSCARDFPARTLTSLQLPFVGWFVRILANARPPPAPHLCRQRCLHQLEHEQRELLGLYRWFVVMQPIKPQQRHDYDIIFYFCR